MGVIFTWNLWIEFLSECLYSPVKWSERISDFDNLMCDAWTNSYWQPKVQAFVLKWSSIVFPGNFKKIRITLSFACREFSNLAIAVLNECYDLEERKAQSLLIRELEHWGAATCVLLAVESNNKKFISQTACQTLLNNVWMGHLSLDNEMLQVRTNTTGINSRSLQGPSSKFERS